MKKVLFLLGQLNDLDIEWMMRNGTKKNLKRGAKLITRGEEIENLYIVLDGHFSIVGDVEHQPEIARIGPGEIVGEMSFLESYPPSVSVVATEPCEVYSISCSVINEKLKTDWEFKSNFYYSLALFLSNRLRKTTQQLGYGTPEETDVLDSNILDGVAQAGARFGKILEKFSQVECR
jgi:CRP/FNR family transcriptional regulator, cyclic AMP receptor protein